MSIKRKINDGRNFTININGLNRYNCSDEYYSYAHICGLTNNPTNQSPSITYKSKSESGILGHDEEVKLEDGMIINCHVTGNA